MIDLDAAKVFWRGSWATTIYHADVHIGAWWARTPTGITYSHDRESLLAWLGGDHSRFGPGQDCYDVEADGELRPSASGFWIVVGDSEDFDELFEASLEVLVPR